ncbi:hypothetical protein [Tsukamurella tyrosinosolvens]|uniref:hypothetical protein n=1 Tax=Tsukamurella tyrosinosolvens TaxID=57704 RepID=UPI002DD44EFA|nr:hypothetical protein [Tsukamurella tyrosinosolvens]MEC4613593.1 hypothetical protein [Tsukamurella tyrosinosolvens]
MRTTLDISPRVLAAARARVNAGLNSSIGEAVSYLAALGLDGVAAVPEPSHRGLVLLPSAPDHVITSDMVEDALLDE